MNQSSCYLILKKNQQRLVEREVVYSICISLRSPSRQPSFYQISNLHGIPNYQKLFIPYEKLCNLRNIDLDYSRVMSGNVHHPTPF